MDSIKVTGIRSYGYTGFLPEERTLGQWFEVDLTLWLDLSKSGKSDDLEDSIDYREAITITKHIIATAKFALVEKLAQVIAEGKIRTYDMMKLPGNPEVIDKGAASTRQMADEIISKL